MSKYENMPKSALIIISTWQRRSSAGYFILSILFLSVIAIILQTTTLEYAHLHLNNYLYLLAIMWLPFLIDALYHFISYPQYSKKNFRHLFWMIVFPPAKMITPLPLKPTLIWLPTLGWKVKNHALSKYLHQLFNQPMLIIALLILPVLLIEVFFTQYVTLYPVLANLLLVGTAFIWLAFTIEFLLKFSTADSKLFFCIENFINLAIILLPLLAFLRGLRIIRIITPFLKHTTLLKTVRVMRLRGVFIKMYRGLLALKSIQILLEKLSSQEDLLQQLKIQHTDKIQELHALEKRINELESSIAKKSNTL